MGLVILLNVVFIALETDHNTTDDGNDGRRAKSARETAWHWHVGGALFLGAFAAELALRWYYHRERVFDDRWTRFDALVVAFGVADVVLNWLSPGLEFCLPLIAGVGGSPTYWPSSWLLFEWQCLGLRVLTIFRTIRLVKL